MTIARVTFIDTPGEKGMLVGFVHVPQHEMGPRTVKAETKAIVIHDKHFYEVPLSNLVWDSWT